MRVPESPLPSTVRRTLVGAACLSLQPLILNAISVPVTAYIIHRLGPDGYGQWMVAAALLVFCGILTNLGLRGAFIRHVAQRPGDAASALAEQLGLRLALSALAGILAIATCVALGYPSAVAWCAIVGAIGLMLTTVATTLSDLLQALQRMRTIAAVNLAAGLALTAVALGTARIGASPVAMAIAYLTGPLLAAAALIAIVRRGGVRVGLHLNLHSSRRLLGRCRFFAAQQLLAAGGTHAESLILPRLVGITQFGFFTAGTILATRLAAFPDGLSTAAYPAMASRCAGGARDAAGIVLRYLLVAALGGAIVAGVGMLVADPIGRILFPDEPTLFAHVVRVTIWSIPLVGVELIVGCALNAAGEDAAQARASVPGAVASLAASVGLVVTFGVAGACWAMLLRPLIRVSVLIPLVARTFWGTPRLNGAQRDAKALADLPLREAA